MFVVDWKSEQDYANLEKAEAADIAWEWLRRDNQYEQEFRSLTAAARQSGAPDRFRKKWGLSFRS